MDIYDIFLRRYGTFTEIQKISMPAIEAHKNVLIIAPTGSGKTEAAMLPIIKELSESTERKGIKVLYITPLRALNRDMILRLEQLCKYFSISVSVRHGDTTNSERSRQARNPPQILITTPETLQSILPTKYLGEALSQLKYIVIDEIHELYYNKRGAQLSLAMERLEEKSHGFIRIGLSATISNPEKVAKFLCGDRDCEIVSAQIRKMPKLTVCMPQSSKLSEELKEKFGLDKPSAARLNRISTEIAEGTSTLVFANTRQIVEAIGSRLLYINKIEPFGGIGVHHSSLERDERIKTENEFKSGILKGLLATSSLELGIDIGSINKVIQYGSPRQALRLMQRVGRSGHSKTGTPKGLIVATGIIDAIEASAVCINSKDGILEKYECQFGAMDVLANQICGIALDKQSISAEDALGIIKRSYIYKKATIEDLSDLLRFMAKQMLIGFDGKNISAGPHTRTYYYSHLSMIIDSRRLLVKNIANNRIISSLDEKFVASKLQEGSVFITKGLPWKIISIDEDSIKVEPSTDLEAAIPDWTGEDIPVSLDVANTVSKIIGHADLIKEYDICEESVISQITNFSEACKPYSSESGRKAVLEVHQDYSALYTFLGTLGNEALSRLIGDMASLKLGRSVNIKASPYMVFVEADNKKIDIVKLLRSIDPEGVRGLLLDMLEKSEILMYHFVSVAKLFGIVDKEAKISRSLTKRLMALFKDTPVYREAIRELIDNYFDVSAVSNFISMLKERKKEIIVLEIEKISTITKAIMDSAYYTRELIMPLVPSNELLNSFVEFLTAKEANLICTYCAFYFSKKISELQKLKSIKCPNCGSPMIAINKNNIMEVIIKRKNSIILTKQETKALKDTLTEASLISSYGWKAVAALSTYGIGPTSASRALMMLRREDRLFYMDLIEAQKQFVKNKKYWSI
ncbi:DEAD/DEAH box helicase [Candidatus Marsarchaeota archaeon]|nr:DEAD/DEAH box helicase [Candidatus Marsarchaeota archaeon]MCL5404887.1 DEAD/DEAH box helicase [Candidatus Marsarchaeota archaeon]